MAYKSWEAVSRNGFPVGRDQLVYCSNLLDADRSVANWGGSNTSLKTTVIDHTHPDAITSICCTDNRLQIAEEIFGKRLTWVPYIRPGFTPSKMIVEVVKANPQIAPPRPPRRTWRAASPSRVAPKEV